MKNRVCEILGIEKPIVQGPTFWLTDGNYVGAISKAGALGVLGFNAGQKQSVYTVEETVENMRREVKIVKSITDKPFGINIGPTDPENDKFTLPMLDMMKENASADVKSLLNRITNIRIISHEQPQDRIIDLARRDMKNSRKYETISLITDNGSLSEFYISENIGRSKNVSFLMIVSGPQGSAVMEIIGNFDVKDISKLSVMGQKR